MVRCSQQSYVRATEFYVVGAACGWLDGFQDNIRIGVAHGPGGVIDVPDRNGEFLISDLQVRSYGGGEGGSEPLAVGRVGAGGLFGQGRGAARCDGLCPIGLQQGVLGGGTEYLFVRPDLCGCEKKQHHYRYSYHGATSRRPRGGPTEGVAAPGAWSARP